MPVAYHMVNYRRLEWAASNSDTPTLETLCRQALSQTDAAGIPLWQRADDRVLDLEDEAGGQILLNRGADLSSAVYGEMCLVERRGLQALLQLKASKVQLSDLTLAEIYELNERSAPTGSQFLRGLVYWMALGNHLFFVKTQAMNADRLRAYLEWLLKSRTGVLLASTSFELRAAFDFSAFAGDIGDIRRLRVTGNSIARVVEPEMDAVAPSETVVKTRRTVAERSFVSEKAEEMAKVLLGPAKAESLVDALGPDEYLSVDATLAVRGRRTQQSRQRMKELAGALADETDAKVQIEGKDGRITEGDTILRTRMPFNVPHDGSNLLEFDNVADQLQEVYSRFVRDGKIPA
jgi:hypothetical protein